MAYGENGVFKFVLQEVTATGDDNFELQIADYYKHFPELRPNKVEPVVINKGEVWL